MQVKLRINGQRFFGLLKRYKRIMSLSLVARKMGVCWYLAVAVATPVLVFADTSFVPQGGEYNIAGTLPGDQVMPAIAVNNGGGYIVWEDNRTDGNGLGIRGRA